MFVPSKPKKNQSKIANTQTSVPNNLKAFQPLPSHEQISQRAYAIYQSGGYANGQDQQDWFRAEKEMFAARK
jgi:hypothetical protein